MLTVANKADKYIYIQSFSDTVGLSFVGAVSHNYVDNFEISSKTYHHYHLVIAWLCIRNVL